MSEISLKPGWRFVKISDCCDQISERIDNPSASGFDRFVGLEHMQTRETSIREWGSTDDVTSTMKLFESGDVLVARRNVYLERAAKADFDGVCSGDAIVLRPKDRPCLPESLLFILNTDQFWAYANSQADGSMSKRLSVARLMNYEFALPPLDEQHRISNLLINMESLSHLLENLENKIDNLRKSTIIDIFSEVLNHLETKLVKICEAGLSQMGRQRSPKYDTGQYSKPYFRAANIFDGYYELDDIKTMDFDDNDFEKYKLEKGDILIVEGGSVGQSAIYQDEIPDACFQNTLIRFRPHTVSSQYSQFYFQYCLYTGLFNKITKSTTIAHLGATRFSNLDFPIVSYVIDNQVVEKIGKIEAAKKIINRRVCKIRMLKKLFLNSNVL